MTTISQIKIPVDHSINRGQTSLMPIEKDSWFKSQPTIAIEKAMELYKDTIDTAISHLQKDPKGLINHCSNNLAAKSVLLVQISENKDNTKFAQEVVKLIRDKSFLAGSIDLALTAALENGQFKIINSILSNPKNKPLDNTIIDNILLPACKSKSELLVERLVKTYSGAISKETLESVLKYSFENNDQVTLKTLAKVSDKTLERKLKEAVNTALINALKNKDFQSMKVILDIFHTEKTDQISQESINTIFLESAKEGYDKLVEKFFAKVDESTQQQGFFHTVNSRDIPTLIVFGRNYKPKNEDSIAILDSMREEILLNIPPRKEPEENEVKIQARDTFDPYWQNFLPQPVKYNPQNLPEFQHSLMLSLFQGNTEVVIKALEEAINQKNWDAYDRIKKAVNSLADYDVKRLDQLKAAAEAQS